MSISNISYKSYSFNSPKTISIPFFLFLLFLVTPFVNDTTLVNSTITSKTLFFVFYLSTLLIFFLFIWILSKIALPLKFSNIDIGLCLFVCFILFNRYIVQSLQGFSIRLIELQGLSVLYIMMRFIQKRDFLYIVLAIILSGSFQALYGLAQSLGFLPSLNLNFNLTGTFFNPGPYGGYLAVVACISYGSYLFKEEILTVLGCKTISINLKKNYTTTELFSKALSYIPLLGIITTTIVLPSTRSRAAWLAIIIPLAFLILQKYNQSSSPFKRDIKKAKTSVKVFFSFFILTLLAVSAYKAYFLKKESADGRMLIWKVTGNIINENPIFGIGYDRFKTYYMDAQAAYFEKGKAAIESVQADNTNYAFNEIIQLVSENGFIALLISIFIVIVCLCVKVDEKYRFLKYLSLIVILSIFIFGMFSYPSHVLTIKMILIVFIALLANIDKNKWSLPKKNFITLKKKWLATIKLSFLVIGIASIIGILNSTITLNIAFKNWKSGLTAYDKGYYRASIFDFEKAFPILRKDGDFLMNYGKALALAGFNKRALNVLEQAKNYLNNTVIETTLGDVYKKLKLYNEAEIAYTKASNMVPNRFYPLYCLVKLYDDTGQNEKAYYKAKELLEKHVKIHSRAIMEIKAEMRKIIINSK